jgi:large subunit ribosomal protein L18
MGRIHVKKSVRGRLQSRAEGLHRLVVTRSSAHIYVQLRRPDGTVIGGVSTCTPAIRKQVKYGGNCAAAEVVGTAIASLAKKLKIVKVCFDRGGYRYHGRVAALAGAARKAGLVF